MVCSLGYLCFISSLEFTLARSSSILHSSGPSIPGNRLISLSSPVVSSNSTANNATIYECYAQSPVIQTQRQPINTTDCNSTVTLMISQADLKNQQPGTTDNSGAIPNRWKFGTCSIALRRRNDTNSFSMFDVVRRVAILIVSCSHQEADFLGGFLSMSAHTQSFVEVSYEQVDSPSPQTLSRNPASATPGECWDRTSPRTAHLTPFQQSDCDANIVRSLPTMILSS